MMIAPIRNAPREPSNDKVFNLNAIQKIKAKNSIRIKKGEEKIVKKSDWLGVILSTNPIINKTLTIGIDKLSDPLELVISAMVDPIAENNAKQSK